MVWVELGVSRIVSGREKLLILFGGWVWGLFRGLSWTSRGCYPISTFREEFLKIEARKGKLYSNLFISIASLWRLEFSSPLFRFHSWFMLMLPCCCFNVCMFVGMLGSFENHVIFVWFPFMFMFAILNLFLHGCFGITHPWRGQKWPILGKVCLVRLQLV